MTAAFASVEPEADAILLAGDLTAHGVAEQAEVLAAACRDLRVPVVAVPGNHDWHAGRPDEIVDVLESAGIVILDRSWTVLECAGTRLGIVA